MTRNGTIPGIVIQLGDYGAILSQRAQLAVSKITIDLERTAKEVSPADKGDFRKAWKHNLTLVAPFGVMARGEVYNPLPYGEPLEHGSPVGGKPWPKAGPRTVERGGRIFSKQAVGGVVGPVLTQDYIKSVAAQILAFVRE